MSTLNKELEPPDSIDLGSTMKKIVLLALAIVTLLIALSQIAQTAEAPTVVHAVEQTQETELEVQPTTEPVEEVTWQDNPNQCNTETQYIAAEAPFNCIDKKVTIQNKVTKTPVGNWVEQCHQWAAQAGVVLPPAAITLIGRESNCNPTICNPNGIACGIPQALPFSKTGCSLSVEGAVCQIKWMQSYVFNRYGSWEAALAHSYAKNWY